MNWKGFFFALITSIMFGSGAILAKVVSAVLSPLLITFLDLLLGFILLVPFFLLTRTSLLKGIKRKHTYNLLLLSLLGTALPLFLVILGLKLTTGIKGGVLIQLQTAAGVLFAIGILHEKISKKQTMGILLMLLGGILVVIRITEELLWQSINIGDVMILLGAMGFGYAFILLKRLTSIIRPLQVAGLRLFIGAIALIPLLLVFPQTLPSVTPSPFILIVLCVYVFTNFSLGFYTLNKAIRLLPAWETATILQTMPIFTVMAGIIILKESLTILQGTGITLMIGGGTLISFSSSHS